MSSRLRVLPVLLASVMLASCVTPQTPSLPPSTGNPSTDAIGSVTQERLDAAVAALPGIVKTVMDGTRVPGLAVAVVWNDKVVSAQGFGVRNVETGTPVTADTVFQLASVSKSVGATVVAKEVGNGTVKWDTPVVTHLPEFALQDPWITQQVTIADLYSHRGGLFEHAGDELEDVGYDRAEVLRRLRQLPLRGFRVESQYTNFGLTAAAESVARAAGLEWAALSERDLYAPLGMSSTSSRYADYLARENRADGHVPDGASGWKVTPTRRMADAQSPAGGVSSSVNDMAKWVSMVLGSGTVDGQERVPADALVPAITAQFVSGPSRLANGRSGLSGYGFNVSVGAGGMPMVSHSGAFLLGTGTTFMMVPGAGLGIVVLTNAAPVGAAESVAALFMDRALYGEPRMDWYTLYTERLGTLLKPDGALVGQAKPSAPAAPKALTEYAGTYANEYYGPATVTVVGNALELGVGTVKWTLEHWDGDTFVYRPFTENAAAGSISKVTFSGNKVSLELLDKHGFGTFTR